MISLAKAKQDLLIRLVSAPSLAVGLDYDGTLAPIRPTPSEAKPSDEVLRLLWRLESSPDIDLLLVTGRSPRDLAGLLGIPEIAIAGNHGLSRLEKGSMIHHRDARSFLDNRPAILSRLGQIAATRPCVDLEDKEVGIALHYRLCPPKQHEEIKRELVSLCSELEKRFKLRLTQGKKVVELRPATDVDKGSIFKTWLDGLGTQAGDAKPLPLYAGDDATDQDVFKVSGNEWVTIQVGSPGDRLCSAKYLASHHRELVEFLFIVVALRTGAREKGEQN